MAHRVQEHQRELPVPPATVLSLPPSSQPKVSNIPLYTKQLPNAFFFLNINILIYSYSSQLYCQLFLAQYTCNV